VFLHDGNPPRQVDAKVSDEVIDAGRPGHSGIHGMGKRAKNIGATLKGLSRVDVGTDLTEAVPGRSAFQRTSE